MCATEARGVPGWTALLVAVWLFPASAAAAGESATYAPAEGDTVPIGQAVVDRDGDRVPDRLGDTVTVVGRATVASGVLFEGRLAVFIQDSTGGVRLYAPDLGDPVRRGDRVLGTGTVSHYRGQRQIDVHRYRVLRGDPEPPPVTEVPEPSAAALERREGELVAVTGEVVGRGGNVGGEYLEIVPPGGGRSIDVFSADWRRRPLELGAVDFGESVRVVGLAGQYDSTAPYTSGYQLYPRTNRDLQRAPLLLGLDRSELTWAGGGLLLLLLGATVGWGGRVRRQRERIGRRYERLFEQNVAGAFLARPDGTLLEVNPATAEMLGVDSPEELEGRDVREVCERPRRQEELARNLDREGSLKNEEIALRSKDGETVWVLVNSFVVDDPETGDPVNIGTMTEITEHVEEERELEELANHDPLTGLPNRRFLEEAVPRTLARAEREEEPVGIVYLDLNDFKEINDERGHAAGDAVLEVVADRLEESARDADLVGRVGGDEFVLVLPALEAREDVMRAARRQAEAAFGEPLRVDGETFSITAKLGVAVCPDDGREFEDLLEKADRAMYRAADGDGPVASWEPSADGPSPHAGGAR